MERRSPPVSQAYDKQTEVETGEFGTEHVSMMWFCRKNIEDWNTLWHMLYLLVNHHCFTWPSTCALKIGRA